MFMPQTKKMRCQSDRQVKMQATFHEERIMSRVQDIGNKWAWSSDFIHQYGIAMDTPIFVRSDSGQAYIFPVMTTNIIIYILKLRF